MKTITLEVKWIGTDLIASIKEPYRSTFLIASCDYTRVTGECGERYSNWPKCTEHPNIEAARAAVELAIGIKETS